MGPTGAESNFFAFTHTDWLKILVGEDLRPFIYLCMLITFCLCRSILMSLASENSTAAFSVPFSCGVTCMMLLSAAAAAVQRISISPCSKVGPAWAASSPGHPCRAQPEGSPLLFSASLFCKWGEEGKNICCRDSGFCLAQQNPFFCICAVLLHSNYCTSQSMQCLDSAQSAASKWTRTLFDASPHQWFGDLCWKAPENGKASFLWCNFLKCSLISRRQELS